MTGNGTSSPFGPHASSGERAIAAQPTLRRSYDIPGYSHGANPIPAVSRVGDLIASGGISGRDLETGALGETLEDQCRLMFALMARMAEVAGVTTEAIAKVTVTLRPGLDRTALNAEWLRYFPNRNSRPARHTVIYDYLPDKTLVQCEFLAWAAD